MKLFSNLFRKSSTFSQIIGLNSLSNIIWGATEQMNAYSTSSYVYACVRLRAEKVGMVNFNLKRGDKDILKHPLLDLLNKPNKFQNRNEFFELYQTHKDLTGAAFIYMLKNGQKIEELHLLRPDKMKIKLDNAGDILAFEYTLPSGTAKNYPPEDILYSISASPFSPLVGHSPLTPGQLSVDTEIQLSKYQNNVLKNGGKVEGVFSFKTEYLSEDQIKTIKDEFANHYSGVDNAGKPLVMYGDSTYQNLGLTPTEMSYLESKRMTRDDVLLLYRVPKALVAQTDDVNYASAKVAKTIFLSETIKPLLTNLTQKLNEFMVPNDLTLTFEDPTPEDIELKLKQIESGIKNHYMTINEAREMQGLDPVTDGEDIMLPFNLVPLEADPVQETEPKKSVTKSTKRHNPLRDKDTRSKYAKRWMKISDKREAEVTRKLKAYWSDQKERLVASIDSLPKQRRKGLLDESWVVEREVTEANDMLLPLISKYLKESGEDIMETLDVAAEFRLTSTLQTTLNQKAEIFAESINKTTFKRLQKEFQESIEAQENRRQLIKRIEKTYGDITKTRAQTIARTEVTAASQLGIQAGYEQSGVEIKIWVATPDERTRDSHLFLDGEERNINQRFSNGLLYPGDPTGDAAETINCRCSI